jgi:predicted HicB family RNase H-like nuclease
MDRLPDTESYLEQPYHIELFKDDAPGGGWTAKVEELRGCVACGDTPSEAVSRVEAAMREWIAEAQANHSDVPKPRVADTHSGRLLVRMPKSLHAELARAAEREEISLNQFISGALASAVGWRHDERAGVDAGAPANEPTGNPPAGGRPDALRATLIANLIVIAIVAAVAVILLVIAVGGGR